MRGTLSRRGTLLFLALALLLAPVLVCAQSRFVDRAELRAESPNTAFPNWSSYGPRKAIDNYNSTYWFGELVNRHQEQYFLVQDNLNRDRDLASIHVKFYSRTFAPDRIDVYGLLDAESPFEGGRYVYTTSKRKNRFHSGNSFANIYFNEPVKAKGLAIVMYGGSSQSHNAIRTISVRDYNPWRNPVNPCDVSGNGTADGNDKRLILDELNRRYSSGQSSRLPEFNSANKPKYDVNNDNHITASDLNFTCR